MIRASYQPKSSLLSKLLSPLLVGFVLAISLLIALNIGVSLFFSGRIFPGISMSGISLSGLTLQQASQAIASTYTFPETGKILLVAGEKSWLVKPVQLGFYLDAQASASAAYKTGRSGSLVNLLIQRYSLLRGSYQSQPSFIFDQKTAVNFLNSLAAEINQPVREAGISLNGTEVVVNDGQPGRLLDVASSLQAITQQIQTMQDGKVDLVVAEAFPVIPSAAAQGELARNILSQPLTLTLPAQFSPLENPIQIDPVNLAQLLAFKQVANGQAAQYQITLDQTIASSYLASIENDLDQVPENARFIFNDDTKQLDLLTPATIGRTLNIDQSIASMNQALLNGDHSAQLSFDVTNPQVTDQMTGAELGITELVQAYTSYFRGSTPDRVQNIKTASAQFHGLLVPPGGTLSMSDMLGDITLDNGYAEALIILGDQTIKGVGGGVCQVSTTLFRTAFYAGFDILERHPHAYRVGYYEQVNSSGGHNTALAGLDATVFVPLVDFKFRNDTSSWLLMETYVSPSNYSLTWKFYSTKDGRIVSDDTTGVTNIVKPRDPVYRQNPDLANGTIKQVDWAVEGADVTVTRTVTKDGAVLHQDRFFTRYEAWGDVFEYGPGTELPTPTPTP